MTVRPPDERRWLVAILSGLAHDGTSWAAGVRAPKPARPTKPAPVVKRTPPAKPARAAKAGVIDLSRAAQFVADGELDAAFAGLHALWMLARGPGRSAPRTRSRALSRWRPEPTAGEAKLLTALERAGRGTGAGRSER